MKPRLDFLKMEGCGNNFIVTHRATLDLNLGAIAPKLTDPHFGAGGDGILVLLPSETHDCEVVMVNPDGSMMGMCGNGIRCVARYAVIKGLISEGTTHFRAVVEGREIVCELFDEGRRVRVNMGPPSFTPGTVPISLSQELIEGAIELDGRRFMGTALSMGNPHLVIFTKDVGGIDLQDLGPALEHHPLFPSRTNVEFVEVVGPDRLRMRVWERGAGPTLACGTGACAVLVAAALSGRTSHHSVVELPGGELLVEWERGSGDVFLTGPAREIYSGVFEDELLRGV